MSFDIPVPDAYRYRTIFDQLRPICGKLSGDKIREVFLKSQLPVETLGKIWDLSDIDNDGSLDQSEFIVAMHLVHQSLKGETLPDKLPQNLVPLDKEHYFPNSMSNNVNSMLCLPPITGDTDFSLALVPLQSASELSSKPNAGNLSSLISTFPPGETLTTQSTHTTPSVWALSNHHSYLQSYNFPEWAISADEHAKNLRVFAAIDLDADGLVSGREVRDILMRSGLPQDVLAHIWELVDIHNTGLLNSEQFTVAMHLATEQLSAGLSNFTLPNVLPASLLPPSLRPVPPDPSIFEESNKLIVEIEALSREKSVVEADYASLTADSQRRASEATAKQRTIDALNHTIRNLANQRREAERRLDDYSREKDTLESALNDIKSHVENERQKVEEMRVKINCQQASTKSQKEEIACLRNELNDLIREEAMLQDKIISNQRRLEQIEKENRLAQSRVNEANNKLVTLESTRGQLLEVLEQYNGLLNGDGSIKEPDEARVKSLLSDESLEDSISNFDTSLSGQNWPSYDTPFSTTGFSTLFALETSRTNTTGAQSVPLPLMSMNPVSGASDWKENDRGRLNSSLGFPFPYDPFDSSDPFKSSKFNGFHKESVEDPFALSITNDPFKDSDPFGIDPFGLPYLMDKDKKSANTIASAFDPFKPDSVYPVLPDNSLVGIDFDAIFGPSNGELMNATDPFGSDPFTPSFLGNNKEMKNHVNSSLKKSPPPRPKTQPTLGKSTRSFKFMDDTSNFRSAESKGDYTDFDNLSTLTMSSRYRKHSTGTGGSSNSFQKPSFSLKSKHSAGKSKKDALNSFTAAVSSPSLGNQNVKTGTKSSSSSDPPLSDEARLSWAIIESQRLAQIEEEARRQEEADLELALRLSRLDSSNQP
ncbi:hypothetical protein MN116_000909 [Schistosoma mekongi]|uniref:Epidermal growth factor receptor substrate 15-like 1 n=1 Tax=Schistosoma mekongi TaxID=38744 RepID=A0AAE1ZLJ4_SCHME|nr:hypothetical protein MN116_000909 [Schistosoma mekongi]